MKQIVLIIAIISSLKLGAQDYKFRENIDKDSLFNNILKDLPERAKEEYKIMYNEGNEQSKEFLLLIFSMPKSSKKELIENYDDKRVKILKLKEAYSKLVPKYYIVDIEFTPAGKIINISESITINIYKENGVNDSGKNSVSENWNLQPGSRELDKVIGTLNWTNQTLIEIKQLLDSANCISIVNGEITTIGFARSGMGKYYYMIFDENLTESQKAEYNNGCEYLFYKDNIVLEYGGGAVGSQCFESE